MWCEWEVLDRFASGYGMLEEVDWQGILNSFYEAVRMKIKCRDASKIPCERLFCINKKLYKIAITLEGAKIVKAQQNSGGGAESGEADKEGEDENNFDDINDLDEEGT
jgi:hypothetical protein